MCQYQETLLPFCLCSQTVKAGIIGELNFSDYDIPPD
jgi:hypothetical protein